MILLQITFLKTVIVNYLSIMIAKENNEQQYLLLFVK